MCVNRKPAETYTGTPCRRCKGTERYKSDRGCVACKRSDMAERQRRVVADRAKAKARKAKIEKVEKLSVWGW